MPSRFAARRYAQALFELGVAGDKLNKWAAELGEMAELVRDPEVEAFLTYPRINLQDKTRVLEDAIKAVSPEVLNLTFLLVKEGFVDRLGQMAADFQKLVDMHDGIERGRLTTAIALSNGEVEDLGQQVGSILKKKVLLTGDTDPALLGGFQARVAGKLLDGSTRTALAILKKELS